MSNIGYHSLSQMIPNVNRGHSIKLYIYVSLFVCVHAHVCTMATKKYLDILNFALKRIKIKIFFHGQRH